MSIDKYEELKRRLLNLSFAWNAIPPQKIKEAISEVDVYISGGCKEVTSVTTTTNAPEVNEVCVHCGLSVAFHVDGTDCNNQTGNKFTPRQSAPEKDVREYNATIMSIRNLEKRLEKLEQAAGGEEIGIAIMRIAASLEHFEKCIDRGIRCTGDLGTPYVRTR